ncbi:peptidylprolyl isomerase [Candidatus Gracilibacteria bacterium]|nr:peptidylprolyl isomerase [Candidatus Gracilibacteria bacterium]NJM88221.1 peptidylprolyl isomerase [Hydrococcus sp. RU_2_2]NJP21382.1 peptidylprolyl isomerase [Hydrococcus sp. CRU_1_1]
MKSIKILWSDWYQRLLKTSVVAFVLVSLSVSLCGAAWNWQQSAPMLIAVLAQGNAITDPNAILRYSLPIDNKAVRDMQGAIEDISNYLRGKRWGPIEKDVKTALKIVNSKESDLLASVSGDRQSNAQAIIAQIKDDLVRLQDAVKAQDKENVWTIRRALLNNVTDLEELMVQGFPFEIPAEYANLPQLKGRATVDVETTQGTMTMIVDGYSAPINGGNFVDLVNRGFYDGLPFTPLEDNFVVQTGDPPGEEAGFIDPKTKQYRAIPLEILMKREELPTYGITLEDAGIYLPDLALPFNAYGAVALARPSMDANGGSSQFFFFKFDNELTPPGFNLMDGRYSVFGYVVDGKEVLDKLTDKDKIISAKVVAGLDNLVQPQS